MSKQPLISIVLPVFNEAKTIRDLLFEIVHVVKQHALGEVEIIAADDCSSDTSIEVIKKFRAELSRMAEMSDFSPLIPIQIVQLASRSGQSESLLRGMLAARGDIIVTMDADGQHDPADIPGLLIAMNSNDTDMVCGYRKNRSDGLARLISSKIANAFRNWLTGDALKDAGCTFRAVKRSCVPRLTELRGKLFGCEFFFHPLLLKRAGFSVIQRPVSHRPRRFGKSSYRLFRGRFFRGFEACIRIRGLLRQLLHP